MTNQPPAPAESHENRGAGSWEDVPIETLPPPKPFLMQFQQQRLPTFYLAPTITFTLGALTVCWVLCALIAAVFLSQNDRFKSYTIRYDNITRYSFPDEYSQNNTEFLASYEVDTPQGTFRSFQGRRTTLLFTLDETLPGPVTMYYILEPFHQNFRSFAESGSDTQLIGDLVKKGDLYLCSPFRSPGEYYKKGEERINDPIVSNGISATFADFVYSPCGVKAWSQFNDTVVVEERRRDGSKRLRCNSSDFDAEGARLGLDAGANPCSKTEIVWPIDEKRFKPAAVDPLVWSYNYPFSTDNDFLRKGWYFNEAGHSLPNPVDKDFISWLAISSTSSAKKVWRILEGDMRSHDENGDPIEYQLAVDEFFPTFEMGVEKKIMFMGGSGSVWLQAPNRQFVYPLLTVAAFSFVCFLALIVVRLCRGKGSARSSGFSNPQTGSAVTAFRTTPSTTLEESLEADSYESGQYVALCVQRRINWEAQKADAKRFEKYNSTQRKPLDSDVTTDRKM